MSTPARALRPVSGIIAFAEKMIDSKSTIYLPAKIQLVILFLTGAGVLLSVGIVVWVLLGKGPGESLPAAFTMFQVSLVASAIALAAIYGERNASLDVLQEKSKLFLDQTLPKSLQRITVTDKENTSFPALELLKGSEKSDIFGRLYKCQFTISEHKTTFKMWAGLNVHRVFVIYFLKCQPENPVYKAWWQGQASNSGWAESNPISEARTFAHWLKEDLFRFTFGGAVQLGYHCNFEPFLIGTTPHISIWMTVPAEKDFLVNPTAKLFWSQDIAMMTESYLRTALRSGVSVETQPDPRPL